LSVPARSAGCAGGAGGCTTLTIGGVLKASCPFEPLSRDGEGQLTTRRRLCGYSIRMPEALCGTRYADSSCEYLGERRKHRVSTPMSLHSGTSNR
jgi:hypothetical protein